jgi:acyl carrier protein
VAVGYLNRPDLTAERFVLDPFSSAGGRLYRTGDLCRWTPDRRIVHLGRIDDQVKIRGHRVELGEIEARLLEHPAVAAAAVAVRGGADACGSGSQGDDVVTLVGYVVPRDGARLGPEALRRHVAEVLPAVMVPQGWVTLDRLPTTPNGKIDRVALPDLQIRRTDRDLAVEGGPAPGTATVADARRDPDSVVERIREIWQDVLRIEDIGLDEDLFDLGGHSLSITRISSRIQKQFDVLVPLDAFFDTPTVGEIAELVERQRGGIR